MGAGHDQGFNQQNSDNFRRDARKAVLRIPL
jgi:hypothetical protein